MSNGVQIISALVQKIAEGAGGVKSSGTVTPKTTQSGATVPFSASYIRAAESALTAQIGNLEKIRKQYRAELSDRNQEGFDTVAHVIASETELDVSLVKDAILELTRRLKEVSVEAVKENMVSKVRDSLGDIDPKAQDKALLRRFVEIVLNGSNHLESKVLDEAYPNVNDPSSDSFGRLVSEVVDKLQPKEPVEEPKLSKDEIID